VTTEQIQKIAWLNRAFRARKAAEAWKLKYQQDKIIAERISGGLASSGARSGNNATEDALIRLAETERKTKSKIDELIQIQEEIADKIMEIDDNELQAVLVYRYLGCMNFEQIAEKMNYDKRTIQRKHKAALDKVVIECHPRL